MMAWALTAKTCALNRERPFLRSHGALQPTTAHGGPCLCVSSAFRSLWHGSPSDISECPLTARQRLSTLPAASLSDLTHLVKVEELVHLAPQDMDRSKDGNQVWNCHESV